MSSVQHVGTPGQAPRRISRSANVAKRTDPHAAEMAMARQMLKAERKKAPAVKAWRRMSRTKPVFARGELYSGAGSFWNLPATGGLQGGIDVGRAVALDYLKSLRRSPEGSDRGHTLAWAAESLAWRIAKTGGWDAEHAKDMSPEARALMGQSLGFFTTLSEWLAASARHLGSGLDATTEAVIDQRIRAGLVGVTA